MDFDDCLGALQAQREALVVAQQLGVFGRQGMGRRNLGAAPDRLQGLVSAGVALPTPVGQQRGVEPLAAQDRADAARPRVVDLAEYPQLVGGREGAAARPVPEFGRGRRRRRNDSRPTASLCFGAAGKSLLKVENGHDHGMLSTSALKGKLPGVACLIIIGTEGVATALTVLTVSRACSCVGPKKFELRRRSGFARAARRQIRGVRVPPAARTAP